MTVCSDGFALSSSRLALLRPFSRKPSAQPVSVVDACERAAVAAQQETERGGVVGRPESSDHELGDPPGQVARTETDGDAEGDREEVLERAHRVETRGMWERCRGFRNVDLQDTQDGGYGQGSFGVSGACSIFKNKRV